MDLDWKSIAGVVGKAAPILGTLIGGPAGAGIGAMIGAALNTDATPDAIRNAIATDPQAALKLLQFQDDNKLKLQEMMFTHAANVLAADTTRLQTEAADRDSARKAAVAGGTAKGLFWLSVGLLILTIGTEIMVLFHGYPDSVPDIVVGRVLGFMDGIAMLVLAFWYGHTNAGARQTELIARAPAIGS